MYVHVFFFASQARLSTIKSKENWVREFNKGSARNDKITFYLSRADTFGTLPTGGIAKVPVYSHATKIGPEN